MQSGCTADVVEGSRLYENIFVSGGALLADDIILKTIEIGKELFCCLNCARNRKLFPCFHEVMVT